MNKREALKELADCDHTFLTKEGCDELAAPFGFKPHCFVHYANPSDPKGLRLDNGARGAVGLAAEELAEQVCNHLMLGRPSAMFSGRGAKLRACVQAIDKFLTEEDS